MSKHLAAWTVLAGAAGMVLAGCGVLVLVLGLVATTGWAKDTAQRTAEAINPEFLEGQAA